MNGTTSQNDFILVVDDDMDNRELIAEVLSASDYTVFACASAAEAEAIIEARGKPRAVLIDIMLPDGDGRAFIDRLRGRRGFDDLTAIFVTGVHASRLGPMSSPVLVKPYDLDLLMDLVSRT